MTARPYGRIYRALRGDGHAAESPAGAPDPSDLARFLRRLGAFPKSWTGRRAETAVRRVVEKMARDAEVDLPEVRADLAVFCSADGVCASAPRCAECPIAEHCDYPDRRLTIPDLPETERPRERLLRHGAESLSDVELLALIIGGGSSSATALDLAWRLLTRYKSFRGLQERDVGELTRVHGIGPAKAARIKAALEIAKRYAAQRVDPGTAVKGSKHVFEYMREKLAGLRKECFIALLLDTKNQLIREVEVAVGSLSENIVHPREVFKNAISESAARVIFVHNHPSGNPDPSPQDRRLTARLAEVGDLVGIQVLDHVIVGRDTYYSFAEQGALRRGN